MLLDMFASLQWYGSATGAMIDTAPTIATDASIKGDKRATASIQAGQIEPYIKGTQALKQTLLVDAVGSLETASPKKDARLLMSVSIGAVPSAFDVAQAVWLQSASAVNVAGTTGQKLNSAGSAGNPWASATADNVDPGTFGELIQKLLTVGKFLGLK